MILNQVYIDQFPKTDSVMQSDKIVAFRKTKTGEYAPIVFNVKELEAFFISNLYLETIEKSIEELTSTANAVEKKLNEALPTKDNLSEYSTISKFDIETNRVEQTSSFTQRLNSKASKEFLNAQYASFLSKLQNFKSQLASGIKNAKWGDDDDGRSAKEILTTLAMGVAKGLKL